MSRESGHRVRFADEVNILSPMVKKCDTLCTTCQTINFQKYRYQSMTGYIALGKWYDITYKKQCPFCRLVVQAFEQQLDRMPLYDDDQILLTNYLSWELGVEMSPYDTLRSAAYSNKFDLRSMAKKFNYSTYRLLVYVKKSHERFGMIQYVADLDDIKDERGQFHGRPVDSSKVDLDLLRSWLTRCENFHVDICDDDGSVSKRLPQNLRLIDTSSRCLVRAPPSDLWYLTLSYVWGTQEMQRDTGNAPVVINRADIQYTESGKELTRLPDRLPQTIEDAMLVTRQLGFRYLWVDALCILQDEPADIKNGHLQNMDAIYNCSTLTIVAGSGVHADTGLPGVSVPRKNLHQAEDIGSLQLAAMSPSFTELENSRSLLWNTRGWTFQEKIFAKRLLLFTDYQVYFRCSESVWTEEIVMETEAPSKSIEARPGKYRWAADRQFHVPSKKLLLLKGILPKFNVNDEWSYLGNFPDYAAAIREYSLRELTNESDKLIAIDGILTSLRKDAGSFIHGLPEAHFLQSLLWHPDQGSVCIRETDELPSWTWAAWWVEHGVAYDVLDIRVIRTIVLLIRNMVQGIKSLGNGGGGSSSGDSGYTDTSSSNDTTSSSTGGGSSSSSRPFKPRNWTTLNAMSKASMNIGGCFSLPMLFRHHTIKHVFLYNGGESRRLKCEEPLSMSTFTKDEHSKRKPNRRKGVRPHVSGAMSEFNKKMAPRFRRSVLAMTTVILQFWIGASIEQPSPVEDDEVGCYELLDNSRHCVGEIWTTRRQAVRGRERAMTFLTVSWGLSLTKANIYDKYIPRWDFDATELPESRAMMIMKVCTMFEEVMNWSSAKHLSASYGRQHGKSMDQQPSLTSFFDALFTARKGKPRPKFLWSTVNLLQVEHVGDDKYDGHNIVPIFKRVGVGRVIFNAWLVSSSPYQEIILA